MAYLLLFLLIVSNLAHTQELPPETQLQLEAEGERVEEDWEDEAFLHRLETWRKHPLNLNEAGSEELLELKFLSALQVEQLLRYRKLMGPLLDLHELQALGFDEGMIRKLRPYVSVSKVEGIWETVQTKFGKGISMIMVTSSRKLFQPPDPDHLGDQNRFTLRYRYQYKSNTYYGILADKDRGEPWKGGGFDFYSAHLFIKDLGPFKSLALGDYSLSLGQGLVHWQSAGWGKGGDALAIKRSASLLQPYRSPGEFRFQRGLAFTIAPGKWVFTAFYSNRRLSLNSSTDSSFGSWQSAGLHRTETERAGRNALGLQTLGLNISGRLAGLDWGARVMNYILSKTYQRGNEPYQLFLFRGRRLLLGSIDLSGTFGNIHFFGELACSGNRKAAFLSGAMMALHKNLDLALLIRNASPGFQSLFGDAFTESSQPVNEQGFYLGLKIRPVKGLELNAFADFFRFPWLRYGIDAPSSGSDFMVQLNYQPSKTARFYLLLRTKHKAVNRTGAVSDFPDFQAKTSIRLGFSTQCSPALEVSGRMEVNRVRDWEALAEGVSYYLETRHRGKNLGWGIRLQRFITDGYESRIYNYESNILYGAGIIPLYGNGYRGYLNASYSITSSLGCWFWIGGSVPVSEGKEAAMGMTAECRIQLSYKF